MQHFFQRACVGYNLIKLILNECMRPFGSYLKGELKNETVESEAFASVSKQQNKRLIRDNFLYEKKCKVQVTTRAETVCENSYC